MIDRRRKQRSAALFHAVNGFYDFVLTRHGQKRCVLGIVVAQSHNPAVIPFVHTGVISDHADRRVFCGVDFLNRADVRTRRHTARNVYDYHHAERRRIVYRLDGQHTLQKRARHILSVVGVRLFGVAALASAHGEQSAASLVNVTVEYLVKALGQV